MCRLLQALPHSVPGKALSYLKPHACDVCSWGHRLSEAGTSPLSHPAAEHRAGTSCFLAGSCRQQVIWQKICKGLPSLSPLVPHSTLCPTQIKPCAHLHPNTCWRTEPEKEHKEQNQEMTDGEVRAGGSDLRAPGAPC